MDEQKKVLRMQAKDFLQYIFYAFLFSMIIVTGFFNISLFINLFLILVVFANSQILHEGGHYFSHWINKRNPVVEYNKFRFPVCVRSSDTISRPFTSWELTRASLFGIILGVIPINFYFFITHNIFGYLILQGFYIYASRFDIMDVRNHVLEYLHNLYIDSKHNKEGL